LAPVENHTDWEQFRSLAPDVILPRIQTDALEAEKAGCNFTASVASACRLSTRELTLSELNNELPDLDHLLKHKQRLRKLWYETRDPACKTAVNWVTKTIHRMTWRKAFERWETKIRNCEVTPQVIWPIAKSIMKRGGSKAPTAVHDPLGLKFLPLEKSTVIADRLENRFTPHDLYDENYESGWRLESKLCLKP
jgi:hypothetical protein